MDEDQTVNHVDIKPIKGAMVVKPTEPHTTVEMRTQVEQIQEMMKAVMREGEHYGTIPGCGPKPALLKPGAEKLGKLFRLRPEYTKEEKDLGGGHREFLITTDLYVIGTSERVGQGVGLCRTDEPKHKSRPPAAVMNTVLKMAKKRSHVDAILTATAASDIFTQDIEDGASDNGYSAKRELALGGLLLDMTVWCLSRVGDEGDMDRFTPLHERVKKAYPDKAVKFDELYEGRMAEFQEADGEGKAN